VHPLAEAGKGGGIGVEAVIPQLPGDLLLAPSAEPGATDQHISRHSQYLLNRAAYKVISNLFL